MRDNEIDSVERAVTTTAPSLVEFQALTRRCRRRILGMTHAAQSGHPGGSLSCVEILTALYFGDVLRYDPARPDWPDRDRFILSKGHATPVFYAILAEAGYFSPDLLPTFRQFDSPLQGHVVMGTPPGVEMSAGALGLGLSFSNGLALAARLNGARGRVYCLLGDGELNEGQVWEAAMAAAHFGFDRITAIVDRNGFQNDGPSDEIMRLDPLAEKWRAFGWHVLALEDGHDLEELLAAFAEVQAVPDGPQVIIAPTIKGKGVSYMEANPAAWHGKGPSDEQLAQGLAELQA